MKKFKEVKKEEFDNFVKNYPRPLDWNVTGICEPPLGSYNDLSLGKWPDTMVAKVKIMDGSEYYGFRTSEYFILDSDHDHATS